jgi:hypothetical protein
VFDEHEIADEYNARRDQFYWVRYASWACGAFFVVLMLDLFQGFELLGFMKSVDNAFEVYIFVGLLWGNLHFAFDFLTDKLGRLDLIPLLSKGGIIAFNVVCIGHIFGIFR